MAGMYMGPSSAFGGAFGGGRPPMWGGNPPRANGGQPVTQGGPVGGGPVKTLPAVGAAQPNVLGPQAVRATGPSQGFDPSYLQNLATSIGGLFSNQKQGGNVMNVNPLGNLGEISPSSSMEGNAPQAGLPQTWLQQALAGLGFKFGPPPADTTTVTPKAPTVGPGSRGNAPNYPSF